MRGRSLGLKTVTVQGWMVRAYFCRKEGVVGNVTVYYLLFCDR